MCLLLFSHALPLCLCICSLSARAFSCLCLCSLSVRAFSRGRRGSPQIGSPVFPASEIIINASPSGDKEEPHRSEAADAKTCFHCGKGAKKKGAVLQRCSICKHASYCGAECQKADWKSHKKTCVPDFDVFRRIAITVIQNDWGGVMEWEGRVEAYLERRPDMRAHWLGLLAQAHIETNVGTGSTAASSLLEQQIDLLGKMQHFRDQGEALCSLAGNLDLLGRTEQASKQYERARDVGAAHGFFKLESAACHGLGVLVMREGRDDEGVDLLRNALAAVKPQPSTRPLLRALIDALS